MPNSTDPSSKSNLAPYKGFGLFSLFSTPAMRNLLNANLRKTGDLFELLGVSSAGTLIGGADNDHSVNMAKTRINSCGELEFIADKKNTGQIAGNFNGGGSGNKAIAGLPGFEGVAMADFPVISLLDDIRSAEDADETRLGISFNALIDLSGVGTGPNVVMVITNTLSAGGGDAPGGESGASASIHSFDINDYSDDGSKPGMLNEFFIVGNLPGTGTGNASPGGNPSWTSSPINLDILLNGGTMPVSGLVYDPAYPNAKLVSCVSTDLISTDGGHPVGIKMSALMAQIGDSSTAKRAVTAITEMTLNGVSALA